MTLLCCAHTQVFSFGVIAWQLFTGQAPHIGMAPMQVGLGGHTKEGPALDFAPPPSPPVRGVAVPGSPSFRGAVLQPFCQVSETTRSQVLFHLVDGGLRPDILSGMEIYSKHRLQ